MDTLNYMDAYDSVEPLNKIQIEDLFGLKTAPLYGFLESTSKMLVKDFWFIQLVVSAFQGSDKVSSSESVVYKGYS